MPNNLGDDLVPPVVVVDDDGVVVDVDAAGGSDGDTV